MKSRQPVRFMHSSGYTTAWMPRSVGHVLRCVPLIAIAAVWAASCTSVLGQFRLDIRDVAETAFEHHAELGAMQAEQVPRQQVVRGARVVLLRNDQVGRLLFRPFRTSEDAVAALERRLDEKIKWFEQSLGLKKEQLEKLRIAGQGDIAALMIEFEQVRAEFDGKLRDQGQLMRLVRKAQPLQNKQNGQIFDSPSILGRVSKGLLQSEEQVQLAAHEDRKLRLFYAGAVNNAIAKLGRVSRLQKEQRTGVRDLLMIDEAIPRIKNFSTKNGGGKYMVTYALYQLAGRRADLSGILTPTQLDAVDPLLVAATQKENTLQREGYLR